MASRHGERAIVCQANGAGAGLAIAPVDGGGEIGLILCRLGIGEGRRHDVAGALTLLGVEALTVGGAESRVLHRYGAINRG